MPDCKYCDRSFDSEDRYHEHLAAEHSGELSRIDRRRVEGVESDDGGEFPVGPAILVGVIGFAAALVVYVIFFVGGGSGGAATINGIDVAQTPTNLGSTHSHGPINVTINGNEIDFSQARFQQQSQAFHFEGGSGRLWHGHAQGITLEYAMATLGFEVTQNSVTFDGTTYRDSDEGTSVIVEVNGESVDPASYVLSGPADPQLAAEQGDNIHIVVTQS